MAEQAGATSYSVDVAILGGGLAGLTLALQLKGARPQTSVLVAEKRDGPAPEAAFKVGESTVEIGAHYFADVVGLRDHLRSAQNPKAGLRFFFPADGNLDIAQRVEWGSPQWPNVPAYQLDRGRLENELADRVLAAGVDLRGGCRVTEVQLGDPHRLTLSRGAGTDEVTARWVVDGTGRAATLKRKLDLAEGDGHHINSAWIRLDGGLDIESWSDDERWLDRMSERGFRKFSTNHLMGEGYWVWLIPLASGPISIGVVADPRFHPWERICTFEAWLDWMKEHEPRLGAEIESRQDQVEDFLKVEDFSYGCKRCFSPERWCLTGEAGPFLDPLYSPGSDFIGLANTFITDAVGRDLEGEDIAERIEAHNRHLLGIFRATLHDYRDQYQLFGDAQVMVTKVLWDYAWYWAYSTPWFFHGKWTDLDFLDEEMEGLFEKSVELHARMQELFRQWHALGGERDWRDAFVTLFPYLIDASHELATELDDANMREKARRDLGVLEAFAVTTFYKAAQLLPDGPPPRSESVNPYAVSLAPERWAQDGLLDGSGLRLRDARKLVKGLQFAWLDEFANAGPAR